MKLFTRVTMPEGAIYNIAPEGGAKFKSVTTVEVIRNSEQEPIEESEVEDESNSPMVVG